MLVTWILLQKEIELYRGKVRSSMTRNPIEIKIPFIVTSTEKVFQLETMASSSRMTTELDKLVYIEMASWKLYRLYQKHDVDNFKLHHQG